MEQNEFSNINVIHKKKNYLNLINDQVYDNVQDGIDSAKEIIKDLVRKAEEIYYSNYSQVNSISDKKCEKSNESKSFEKLIIKKEITGNKIDLKGIGEPNYEVSNNKNIIDNRFLSDPNSKEVNEQNYKILPPEKQKYEKEETKETDIVHLENKCITNQSKNNPIENKIDDCIVEKKQNKESNLTSTEVKKIIMKPLLNNKLQETTGISMMEPIHGSPIIENVTHIEIQDDYEEDNEKQKAMTMIEEERCHLTARRAWV